MNRTYDMHCPMVAVEQPGLNFRLDWCRARVAQLEQTGYIEQRQSECYHTKIKDNEDVRLCLTYLSILTEEAEI